ncbi:hypothetical protein MKX03_010845 [Papaver bracteatum]|nr:hypothetical protein MKX03_010845 [Papaver bracteatum]
MAKINIYLGYFLLVLVIMSASSSKTCGNVICRNFWRSWTDPRNRSFCDKGVCTCCQTY